MPPGAVQRDAQSEAGAHDVAPAPADDRVGFVSDGGGDTATVVLMSDDTRRAARPSAVVLREGAARDES
ncbi:hypothetical protein LK09_14955 [Microbacterium mangrovi]|uniref:Uncharacterized protein n=1 Tax=Microbacterium mangrovi TaxID=1348253 RepID=A0A0B2A4A4_9MICO|nr:hypothetical protein LK09_14955 [Microbacterium mangrovi]